MAVMGQLPRRDLDLADPDRPRVKESQVDQRLQLVVVAGIAQRLVLVVRDLPLERPGTGGGAARGVEGVEGAEPIDLDRLLPAEGRFRHPLSAPQDDRLPGIFVRQSLEAEDQLVSKRWPRMLRQPSAENAGPDRSIELVHPVYRQRVSHPGGQAAIGNDGDAGGPGLGIQGQFRLDDVRIAAQVVETGAGGDGGLCRTDVQEVGDSGQGGVDAGKRARQRGAIADIHPE
ncbi:MAG: hypothetical protein FD129_593 [bacterium]|nr:MAG: hypothetical protein FD129_593 [bacterium]